MKWALCLATAGVSFLPVWRSGMREHLNFWQFVRNHTIWGPPVAYVPEEEYTRSQSSAVDEVERASHRIAVHGRAVRRAQVLDLEAIGAVTQDRVPTRDGRVIDHDVGIGHPADDGR